MIRSAEDRCVDDVERLLAARLDALELMRRAVERYRKLVPFDWYCVNVTDPIGGVTTRAARAPGEPLATKPPSIGTTSRTTSPFTAAWRRIGVSR